jgi:hypothetical protein
MMRGVALQLVALMLVAACGRTDPGGPAEPSGDASTLDGSSESNLGYLDATVADSQVGADQSADQTVTEPYDAADDRAAADSALEASPPLDAAEPPDAQADALASDAAVRPLPCDQCSLGDQECRPLPQVCSDDDAGVGTSCETPGNSIWTCVAGDAGCALWAGGGACRSDVPCCVPCVHAFACPLGSDGDRCAQDTDCAFDACDAVSHECVSSKCNDHRQDDQESDVDCGGQTCNACLVGQRCQSNFDCQSGHLCAPSHLCE